MRKQSRALVALAVGIVATSVPAFADVVGQSIGSDLVVDAGFGGGLGYTVVNWNDADGTWDEAVRLIPADNGATWMIGFHRTDATGDRAAISRLDADGALDPTYGTGGKQLADTGIGQIHDAIRVGDRFYVAGIHYLDTPGLGDAGVACFLFDGTPCTGFGNGGTVELALAAPGFNSDAARILHRDGALYVVGNTDPGGANGHSSDIVVAKLDAATGALDSGFGDGSGPLPGSRVYAPDLVADGNDYAYAAAFDSNGAVLVGGSAQGDRGSVGYVLAIDAATGVPEASFGDAGYVRYSLNTGVHFDDLSIHAIQVAANGRIIAAGNANHDDEFFNTLTAVLLVSLQPDGTPTPGFGVAGVSSVEVGINTSVTDLVVRANGDLVVSTPSNGIMPNPYNGDTLQSIVQFDASGSGPTSTVSIEYPSQVTPQGWPMTMLVDANDRVLVGGFRLWDFNFPIPDSDHVVTRLMRDGIFGNGFDS
ncbi:hypothetical protein [Dokdonella sp.]|uniref:hypothetical protein n=1 Tax=Dokdonella sp. TaxID=2291710 RepID=UPI0037834E00